MNMSAALPPFGGIRIFVSEHAVQDVRPVTWVNLPNPSRNRSARIQKKIVRITAVTTTTGRPAIYKTPQGIVCHPDLYARLKSETLTPQPLQTVDTKKAPLGLTGRGVFFACI